MKNIISDFFKQTNRLLDWRIMVGWSALILLAEFCVANVFDWVVAYEEPQVLPPTASPYEPMTAEHLNMVMFKAIAVFFAVVLFSVYRSRYFQPFSDPYRSWLIRTPWTADKKLPLGPMHITASDLMIVFLLAIPIWGNWLLVLAAVAFFLAGYVAGHLNTFYHADQLKWLWIGIAILCTTLLFPKSVVVGVLSFGAVVFLVILSFVQQSALRNLRRTESLLSEMHEQKLGNSSAPFGYPIGPNQKDSWGPDISMNVLAVSLVWSMFCVGRFLSQFEEATMSLALGLVIVAAILAVLRLRALPGHVSPFDRFFSGRMLIPGYDVVFLAPLVILILPGLAILAIQFDFPIEYGCPIATACSFLVFKYMPPNLEKWKTTGHHRIVAVGPSKNQQLKFNTTNSHGSI